MESDPEILSIKVNIKRQNETVFNRYFCEKMTFLYFALSKNFIGSNPEVPESKLVINSDASKCEECEIKIDRINNCPCQREELEPGINHR